MARYSGVIGYGVPTMVSPGVYDDVITERHYYGDIKQSNSKLRGSDSSVNENVVLQNIIEILADQFVWANIDQIRYVSLYGKNWKVSGVEVKRPRLVLTVGEVYSGPTPNKAT